MSDLHLQVYLSPDSVTAYRFLMLYLDHFTKKINLTWLKRKTGEEVTEALLDIFCESGPPHILHSDNDRTLVEKLPSIRIIHSKPRHPESQGAIERANRDIKYALFMIFLDNGNDQTGSSI